MLIFYLFLLTLQLLFLEIVKSTSRNKSIIIFGGNGNIGGVLTSKLISDGYNIIVFDVSLPHTKYTLDTQPKSNSTLDEDFQNDIRHKFAVRDIFRKTISKSVIFGIIHMASISRPEWCENNIRDCKSINVNGTKIILNSFAEVSRGMNISYKPWFMYFSTTSVYYATSNLNGQDELIPSTEISEISAKSTYSKTKIECEDYIQKFGPGLFQAKIILRISNVYGGHNDHSDRFIPTIVRQFYARSSFPIHGFSQMVDFVYIDDVIMSISKIIFEFSLKNNGNILLDSSQSSIVNICSGTSRDLNQTLTIVGQITNQSFPPMYLGKHRRNLDSKAFLCDIEKIKDIIKRTPVNITSFQRGIQKFILERILHDIKHLKTRLHSECIHETENNIMDLGHCSVLFHQVPVGDHTIFGASSQSKRDSKKFVRCVLKTAFHCPEQLYLSPVTSHNDSLLLNSVLNNKLFPFISRNLLSRYLNVSQFQTYDFRIFDFNKNFTKNKDRFGLIEVNSKAVFKNFKPFETKEGDDSDVFTIIYCVKQHAFAVLKVTGHVILQLTITGDFVSVMNGDIIFNFGIVTYTCKKAKSLPFLSRSVSIYEMRNYRQKEENLTKYSNDYAIECSRILKSIEFYEMEYVRISTMNLNHVTTVSPNPMHYIRKGKTMSKMNFTLFSLKPPCDYDCKLLHVCLKHDDCRCVEPQICFPVSTFPFEPYQGTNIVSFPPPQLYKFKMNQTWEGRLQNFNFVNSLTQVGKKIFSEHGANKFKMFVWNPPIHLSDYFFVNSSDNQIELCQLDHWHPKAKNCKQLGKVNYFLSMNLSVPIEEADFILMPFVVDNDNKKYLKKKVKNSKKLYNLLASAEEISNKKKSARFILIYSGDMGACAKFRWSEYQFTLEGNFQEVRFTNEAFTLSPFGGYNTNCYLREKDVPVASVSLNTVKLYNFFSELSSVVPSSLRPYFLFFQGTLWGTGAFMRLRMSNKQLYPKTWKTKTFVNIGYPPHTDQTSFYLRSNSHTDNSSINASTGNLRSGSLSTDGYMLALANSKFCLLLRGTTGWSFRLSDAIYAGCLPVFIIDMLDNFYFEIINYSSFSIFIEERNIENIEDVLLNISDERVNQMQARLLLVRDAFLYNMSSSGDLNTRRDSFFYTVLSLGLKTQVKHFG